jgi:hypothetical protein
MDYKYEDFVAEWSLLARSQMRKPDVVYVLYGDEQPTGGYPGKVAFL